MFVRWCELSHSKPLTDACPDAVALAVQQATDLHQFTVALYVVVYHSRFHQERVVTLQNAFDSLFGCLHEDALLLVVHESPHPLVGRQF